MNDRTVKLTQGDLMLCPSCDRYRFGLTTPAIPRAQSASHDKTVGSRDRSTTHTVNTNNQLSSLIDQSVASVSATATPAGLLGPQSASRDLHEAATVAVKYFINEMLVYILIYRNKSNVNSLKKVVLNYYSPTEITEGKRVLLAVYTKKIQADMNFVTNRRNSVLRAAHEADLDDIWLRLIIWIALRH